jgi:hypothetical protein
MPLVAISGDPAPKSHSPFQRFALDARIPPRSTCNESPSQRRQRLSRRDRRRGAATQPDESLDTHQGPKPASPIAQDTIRENIDACCYSSVVGQSPCVGSCARLLRRHSDHRLEAQPEQRKRSPAGICAFRANQGSWRRDQDDPDEGRAGVGRRGACCRMKPDADGLLVDLTHRPEPVRSRRCWSSPNRTGGYASR